MTNSTTLIKLPGSDHQDVSNHQAYVVIQAVNIAGICQLFGVLGVVTNVVSIIIFMRMGFRETINISLFVLTMADFGASFTMVFIAIFLNPWFHQLHLTFDPIQIAYFFGSHPRFVFAKITTVLTAYVSFERCLCVTMPLKVKTIITGSRVKITMIVMVISVAATSMPFYFYHQLIWVFSPQRNKTILSVGFTEDRDDIEPVFYPVYNLFYTLIAFVFITICTAILVLSLRKKSTWRQTVTSTTDASVKEKRISKTIVIISSLFIVCYLPNLVLLMWMTFDPSMSIVGSKYHILVTFASFCYILEQINSSVNLFIYYKNSSAFRTMLDKIFFLGGRPVQTKQ